MVRYSARDGLTTPSIGIRSRFFRKKFYKHIIIIFISKIE